MARRLEVCVRLVHAPATPRQHLVTPAPCIGAPFGSCKVKASSTDRIPGAAALGAAAATRVILGSRGGRGAGAT